MTAADGSGAGLAGIAGWDLPQLRGAAGTLVLVAERLVPWRFRLDAVGRRLDSADCWSGPAGSVAAAALREVSTVSTGLQAALEESARSLAALVAAADEAQELAVAALAVMAAGGVPAGPDGRPVVVVRDVVAVMAPDQRAAVEAGNAAAARAAALAEGAFAAADRARTAAVLAGDALDRLRPRWWVGPIAGFPQLAARLAPAGPVVPPDPPRGVGPRGTAVWWAALTTAEQWAALGATPAALGALDGVPAWARDQANRLLLAGALRAAPVDGDVHRTAVAVAAELGRREAAGEQVQLLQFQPEEDLVGLGLGDLDAAAAVAVLVPGILTSPEDDLRALAADAAAVGAAARAAAPGLAVAAVAWLGYRTPASVLSAPSGRQAQRGGPALDRALDGLAASRALPGGPPPPRTTVLAHSYGTLVAGRAAQAPGPLAADALVLLGSPGTVAITARGLEADEVYGAWSLADPVSWSGWFGRGPVDPWFGDTPLPTEVTQGHTGYYDPDRPTLAALGEVVAGTRERS